MPGRTTNDDSDWSDDEQSEIETSVLLGYPDGVISKQEDIDDAAVSRIGGHPVRLVVCLSCIFSNSNIILFFCWSFASIFFLTGVVTIYLSTYPTGRPS